MMHTDRESQPGNALARTCTAAIAALLAGDCGGAIEGSRSPGSGAPGAGTGPGARPDTSSGCGTVSLPAPRVWRLTHRQYAATLNGVLGMPVDTSRFPAAEEAGGLDNQAGLLAISPLLAERYWETVDSLAARADLAKLLPCQPADPQNATCVGSLVTGFGKNAWRRPLQASEVENLMQVYRDVKTTLDATAAVQSVLKAMLMSPHFLYRAEIGRDDPADAKRRRLTSHEIASALSYLLWDAPPDEALLALADGDRLVDPARIAAEAERMLGDRTRAGAVLYGFLERWLGIGLLPGQVKDRAAVPFFTPALMEALALEARTFVDDALWAGDGSLRSMLGAQHTFANAQNARVYGLSVAGVAMQRVALDPKQRRGMLTHAPVLAAHSQESATGLVERGRFLAETVLCMTVPEPENVDTSGFGKLDPSLSAKEKWRQHAQDPACSACHKLFDALGLALESYDAIGRYRATAEGKPIDPSGEVRFTPDGAPVPVSDAVDLMGKLAAGPEVYNCFAPRYFRYASGRTEEPGDRCAIETLRKRFADSGFQVKALVKGVVASDAFRYRAN